MAMCLNWGLWDPTFEISIHIHNKSMNCIFEKAVHSHEHNVQTWTFSSGGIGMELWNRTLFWSLSDTSTQFAIAHLSTSIPNQAQGDVPATIHHSVSFSTNNTLYIIITLNGLTLNLQTLISAGMCAYKDTCTLAGPSGYFFVFLLSASSPFAFSICCTYASIWSGSKNCWQVHVHRIVMH